VDQPFEPPHPNGGPKLPEPPTRRRIWRWIATVGIAVVLVAWGIAIFFSLTAGSPEDLDDDALAALEAACDETLAALEAPPQLTQGASADENISRVEFENDVFTEMVDRVDAIAPDSGDAARALDAWLDDWRALIAARAAFAIDLADDGTARLRVPSVSSGSVRPISDRMNEYATARGLDQCTTDALQAENVDGVRAYGVEG
jgi:hypothetical protein